jgi:phage shock protein A
MTSLLQALRQARDALIYHRDQTRPIERTAAAIAAADEALAAHDAEPGAAPVEPTVEQHQLELVALREQVDHLRANLRVMTDAFEDLLESGQPPKGRSLDDKQAAQAWLEDAHAHIAAARRAFERPEEAPQQGQRGAGGYNS